MDKVSAHVVGWRDAKERIGNYLALASPHFDRANYRPENRLRWNAQHGPRDQFNIEWARLFFEPEVGEVVPEEDEGIQGEAQDEGGLVVRPFVSQAPVLKECLTPPWVEQYLYHLDKGVRRAGWRGYSPLRRGILIYTETEGRWFKYLVMRQMQHKFMKDALYQVGHDLWRRIQ